MDHPDGQKRQNVYELLFGPRSNFFPNAGNSSDDKKRKRSTEETYKSEKRRKTDLDPQQQLITFVANPTDINLTGEVLHDHIIRNATLLPSGCLLDPLSQTWFVSPVELQITMIDQSDLLATIERKGFYLYFIFAKNTRKAEFRDLAGNFIADVRWEFLPGQEPPLAALLNSWNQPRDGVPDEVEASAAEKYMWNKFIQTDQYKELMQNNYGYSAPANDTQIMPPRSLQFLIKDDTARPSQRVASITNIPNTPVPRTSNNNQHQNNWHDSLPLESSADDTKIDPDRLHISFSEIKLGRRIGEGANGIVNLAEWNNQKFAVKRLKTNNTEKGSVIKEAEALVRVRHVRIVSLVGITADPETDDIMLVIEYLENGSLDDLISKGDPLSRRDIVQIALDVAEGLHFLHSQKIIHRDLKSANVLLYDDKKRAKLSDFGTARILGQSSKASTVLGTFGFMAPEILFEREKHGVKADIYSFGALLYHMLTRKYPSVFQTADQALKKIKEEIKDDKFREFIINCCKMEPEERPTIEECIAILQKM